MTKLYQNIYKLKDGKTTWEQHSKSVCATKETAEELAKEFTKYMEIEGGNTKVESYKIMELYL